MPLPQENEKFERYLIRMGLDPEKFPGNTQLAAYLTSKMSPHFEKYMEEKRKTRWREPDV